MERSLLRRGSRPLEKRASVTATHGSQRAMLSRHSLRLGAVRYTLDVMPAVTGISAMRQRSSRSLVRAFSGLSSGSSCVNRAKRALCGADMLPRSGDYAGVSNFLIATAVPARSLLRPSLGPRIWQVKPRPASVTPQDLRLPRRPYGRADLQEEPSILTAGSVKASVGERFLAPQCLAGGFAQLGSI